MWFGVDRNAGRGPCLVVVGVGKLGLCCVCVDLELWRLICEYTSFTATSGRSTLLLSGLDLRIGTT